MKPKDILTPQQYQLLQPYDEVLTKLARNQYVNYRAEVNPFPVLLEVYSEIYHQANGRPYVHYATACGSCSGSVAWAKRLGRYYNNHKAKITAGSQPTGDNQPTGDSYLTGGNPPTGKQTDGSNLPNKSGRSKTSSKSGGSKAATKSGGNKTPRNKPNGNNKPGEKQTSKP